MCDRCNTPLDHGPKTSGLRRKIWELPTHLHCSIIGTCLPVAILEGIVGRAGFSIEQGASDHSIHAFVVQQASQAGKVARLTHKALDARYGSDIRRFVQAKDAQSLEDLWARALRTGRIVGAYWALMSLRSTPTHLVTAAFGEVHMLSHFLGGHNRNSLQRLAAAEQEVENLGQQIGLLRAAKLEQERNKDRQIQALEAELCRLRARLGISAAASKGGPEVDRLRRRMEQGERRLAVERTRRRTAEAELVRLRTLAYVGPARGGDIAMPSASRLDERTNAVPDAPPVIADGKCVLYVGGRQNLVPYFRSAVERRNGRLIHHDGGIEKTPRILENLVGQADVVLCPIDCVSHDACLRIKRLCQRMAKPFLPLRSSSASAFKRAFDG